MQQNFIYIESQMSHKKGVKVITKRDGTVDLISDVKILLKTIQHLRGKELVPKGVFRFRSFEEADEWMTKMMVNTLVRRQLRT